MHEPVLVREVLRLLALEPGQTLVDGTVGAGGHGVHILKRISPGGTLFGLDRDPEMLSRAAVVLSGENCHLVQTSYSELRSVLDRFHVDTVDRILLDLGLSSDQLDDDRRGFRFDSGGPLDMRFDPTQGRPAVELLATESEEELARIFREYGEEPHSSRIARDVVQRRRANRIETGRQLAELIAGPQQRSGKPGRHPATLVFQALRIAVNEELRHLEITLNQVFQKSLRVGGIAVVITFHSLEDRLVKTAFRDKDQWENLTPKPVTATAVEKKMNPRSRTAKLRAAILKAPGRSAQT